MALFVNNKSFDPVSLIFWAEHYFVTHCKLDILGSRRSCWILIIKDLILQSFTFHQKMEQI